MRKYMLRNLIVGFLLGIVLTMVVGWTTAGPKAELYSTPVQWVVDGTPASMSDQEGLFLAGEKHYVPSAIKYDGVQYAPISLMAKVTNRGMEWVEENSTFILNDMTPVPEPVTPLQYKVLVDTTKKVEQKLPDDIKQWVDANKNVTNPQIKYSSGSTYVVYSRGEQLDDRFGIQLDKVVKKGENAVVTLRNIDPEGQVNGKKSTPVMVIQIEELVKNVEFELN